MSSIESLPHDQQAVLGLLLKQGKTYDDVGAMLKIDRESVRWRAHQAVNALAPPEPDAPIEGNHWRTVDYLLGQATASERAETREILEGSADERAWARSMSTVLAPMAAGEMPEIPGEPADAAPGFAAPAAGVAGAAVAGEVAAHEAAPADAQPVAPADEQPAVPADAQPVAPVEGEVAAPVDGEPPPPGDGDGGRPQSQLGRMLLYGGLAIVLLVAILLALGVFSSGSSDKNNSASTIPTVSKTTPKTTPATHPSTTPKTTPKTTPATTPSTTPKTTPKTTLNPKGQINLAVPGGKAKSPFGIAEIFDNNGSMVANIVGQGLPASGSQFAYAVWLTGANISAHFVGFTPTVKSDGNLRVLAPLPKNVSSYKNLEITKETTSTPQNPGTVVLTGVIPNLQG